MTPTQELPFVTICMPVYNAIEFIRPVLNALYNIDYPKKLLRVIYVDNCSTDGTYRVLQKFKKEHAIEYEGIILKKTCKRGLGHVRNTCLKYRKGFVFWAESDVIVPPKILKKLLLHLRREPRIGWVHAPCIRKDPTFYERIFISRLPENCRYAEATEHTSSLIRPEVIEVMGPFYEDGGYPFDSWEAAAQYVKVRKAGYRILIDGSIHCIHLRRREVMNNYTTEPQRKTRWKIDWSILSLYLFYYFYKFSEKPVHEMVKAGDIVYCMRLIYYFLLPYVVGYAVISWQPLLALVYLLPPLVYYVAITKGWTMKFLVCLFIIPVRVIIAQGYAWMLIKRLSSFIRNLR